jgi:hypothetical protein
MWINVPGPFFFKSLVEILDATVTGNALFLNDYDGAFCIK